MFHSHRSSVLIPTLKTQSTDDLLQRVNRYLDRHPEVSRESLLRNALSREISERERTIRSTVIASIDREEDVRNHAWLEERLNAVRHERHGFLSRIRGVFSKN